MRIAFLTGPDTAALNGGPLFDPACVIKSGLPPRNLRDRVEHDAAIAEEIRSAGPDYVFAVGYPFVLTEPMLDAFTNRIVCVHDGDLTDRDDIGQRKWIGPHAVLDAIIAGAQSTRTSLYVATRDVGHGPLLLVGRRHPVSLLVAEAIHHGDFECVVSYARLHRSWMRRSWGSLIQRAIEILTAGSIQIAGDTVWIDGVPGPCRLGEAPDFCEDTAIRRGVPSSCPFVQQ